MAIQIKRFEVSENCKNIDTEAMLAEVAKIREYALNGIESDSDLMGSIQAIVAFQLPDGSFPVTAGTPLPSDASVDLVFRPTYSCCQALVHALSLGIKPDDVREPLSRGLAACCRRNLEGHGYEALERQAEDLADFGHCGLAKLLDEEPGLCPAFTRLVGKTVQSYKHSLETGNVVDAWGKDLTSKLSAAVDALGCTDSNAREALWVAAV